MSSGSRGPFFKHNRGVSSKYKKAIKGIQYTPSSGDRGDNGEFLSTLVSKCDLKD